MIDRYTKIVLTVIALGLWLHLLQPIVVAKPAQASDASMLSANLVGIDAALIGIRTELIGIASPLGRISSGECSNTKICD